jgi:glucose-6-phosphate 1-dehydrogenase
MLTQGDMFGQNEGDVKPAPDCVFVLFGATGDLAARKIAPALYNLHKAGLLTDKTAVLGVARRPRSDEQFREEMLQAVQANSRTQPVDEELWGRFARRWHYHVTHADAPDEYDTLRDRLAELDRQYDTGGNRLFYMAMTPDTFAKIAANLGRAGLNAPARQNAFVRLVTEKPFGKDQVSARLLNEGVLEYFGESQVFRIDHYLGKETVQNILVLRFANRIFEPLFNRDQVAQVQITTAETAGMEGRRGPYYEQAGALRDMVQNHMLQLLALTAMDAPASMNSQDIRNEKFKVLRAIRPLKIEEVAARTVRGQYGPADGVAGYRQEEGVAPDSTVETYAAVKLHVDNWRWAGVPFYLRTGKRLAAKASQVLIVFRKEPVSLFTDMGCDARNPNRMAIRIYPDEGFNLVVDTKVPGVRMLLRPEKMDFQYGGAFESASPEAYELLLLEAMRGDHTLFIRDDEVDASWRIIDSIHVGWRAAGKKDDLMEYRPGSWGPAQAEGLFDDAYTRWQPL